MEQQHCKAVRFNNAGVDCALAGRNQAAWDLFKGALEMKLAAEYAADATPAVVPDDLVPAATFRAASDVGLSHAQRRAPRSVYLQNAELRYAQWIRHRSDPAVGTTSSPSPAALANGPSTQHRQPRHDANAGAIRVDGSGREGQNRRAQTDGSHGDERLCFTPFICQQPVRLQERSVNAQNFDTVTRRDSAAIVFNLAVLDHRQDKHSSQAVALYELAMTLVAGDKIDELGVALINNIGVWCFENGDIVGAASYADHLSYFLDKCGGSFDPAVVEGIRGNILWMVNIPLLLSPAA